MHQRSLAAPILLLVLGCFPILEIGGEQRTSHGFDPLQGALAANEPQPIYAADPKDAWNQVFFMLFTRSIPARVIADGVPVFAAGDDRLRLGNRRVTRIESGDRAIDPLYPSWLWMGSSLFDFDEKNAWRILREPRYSQFVVALESVRRTAASHPPLARALMQADLWSVYDMLHAFMQLSDGRVSAERAEQQRRAQALLPVVGTTMRALALPAEEIAGLPNTYAAAAKALHLPNLLDDRGEWMEIVWFPQRSHESAAGDRRAARVFLRPRERPHDEAAFLGRLRDGQGDNLSAIQSVALLVQLLLVATDATVIPSPIFVEAQFRGSAARNGAAEIPQYELSRQRLLTSPAGGGLVGFGGSHPAYLPAAGNDLAFATPPQRDRAAVVAPLSARCSTCHGAGSGVGHLMTFAMFTAPDRPSPPVRRLVSAQNLHARDVAQRKMALEGFKSLRQHWQ